MLAPTKKGMKRKEKREPSNTRNVDEKGCDSAPFSAKKNKSGKKQVEKHTLTKKAEQRSKKTTEYMRDCESVLNCEFE